jgi:hypothetical protein
LASGETDAVAVAARQALALEPTNITFSRRIEYMKMVTVAI